VDSLAFGGGRDEPVGFGPDTGNGFFFAASGIAGIADDRAWGWCIAPVACLGVTLAVTLGCALASDQAQVKARVLP
jgi:hypothetical protein